MGISPSASQQELTRLEKFHSLLAAELLHRLNELFPVLILYIRSQYTHVLYYQILRKKTLRSQGCTTHKPVREEKNKQFCPCFFLDLTKKRGEKKQDIYSTVSNICRCFPYTHSHPGTHTLNKIKNIDMYRDISKLKL